MSEPMTSPGDRQPPKEWWLENSCRIAAFRLRQNKYISANTVPLREQVRDYVEFVRIVWKEIERNLQEEESRCGRVAPIGSSLLGDVHIAMSRVPTDHTKMICPNRLCTRMFIWKAQNKGKLWPEQRAYKVLR